MPPQYPVAYLFLREKDLNRSFASSSSSPFFDIFYILLSLAVVPLRSKPIGRNAHQHLLTIDLMWVHFSFLLCLRLTLVSCLVFFFPFVFVFFNVSLPLVEQGNKIPNAEAYTVLASSAQIDRDQKRRISIDYHIYPSVCTRVILHVQSSDHSTNQSILLTHPLVSS